MIIKYSKNYCIPFNTFLCICFLIFIASKHFDKETDFRKQKGMEYRLSKSFVAPEWVDESILIVFYQHFQN